MFKGTYRYRIDKKGRVAVPVPFRKALSDARLVITQLDECVAAYPPSEWSRLTNQLSKLPAFSREVKALTRLLASRAADCGIDVQGRIRIPPLLRGSVRLEREAVVVGVLSRFELWNPEVWENFVTQSERLLDGVTFDLPWPPPVRPLRAPSTGET